MIALPRDSASNLEDPKPPAGSGVRIFLRAEVDP